MRSLTFQATLRVAILILATLSVSPAQGSDCNIAPNGRFEEGAAATVDDWEFIAVPGLGQGTFSVSDYPNELQSGARGVKISVTQAGSVYLTTTPQVTSIPVLSATTYVLSARLLSFNGEKAGLWLIEWSGGNLVQGNFLSNGGGSGAWETLESTFTTQPSTTHVSIRLIHHISSGVFYWDDVSLWKQEAGKRCADLRHYVTQSTPGFHLCNSNGICLDGNKNAAGEFVVNYTHGIRDYYTHNGDGQAQDLWIGVHKNLDSGVWRCFADPGEQCGDADSSNAQFTPHTMRLNSMLPVLTTSIVGGSVTTGAQLVHDWERYDVRRLNPFDGSQPGLIGPIWSRTWSFIASSVNFGGSIGVRTNVLVLESETAGLDASTFGGGERMERYYFVEGYGRVREGGWEDQDCRSNPSALTCDGTYNLSKPGEITFNSTAARDFTFDLDVPYGSVSWW